MLKKKKKVAKSGYTGTKYTFREKECHDLLDETIVIIFAELTRFHKAEDECVTLEDKLLYLLKNSGKMERPPKWATEKPCKDLLDAFEIGDFNKVKREQYDKAAGLICQLST